MVAETTKKLVRTLTSTSMGLEVKEVERVLENANEDEMALLNVATRLLDSKWYELINRYCLPDAIPSHPEWRGLADSLKGKFAFVKIQQSYRFKKGTTEHTPVAFSVNA